MQTSSHSEWDWKIIALGLVQGLGVLVAFILHIVSIAFYDSHLWVNWIIGIILGFIFLASVVIIVRRIPTLEFFNIAFDTLVRGKFQIKAKLATQADLLRTTRMFATADYVGSLVCIMLTGGSEGSFFIPFLFVITPFIVLLDVVPSREVVKFALLAVGIYVAGLCPYTHFDLYVAGKSATRVSQFALYVKSHMAHAVFLSFSTTLVTLIPVLFYVFKDRSQVHPAVIPGNGK